MKEYKQPWGLTLTPIIAEPKNGLTLAERGMLQIICANADYTSGKCAVSIVSLAEKGECSVRVANTHVHSLVEKGFVQIAVKREGRSNIIQVTSIPEFNKWKQQQNGKPATEDKPKPSQQNPEDLSRTFKISCEDLTIDQIIKRSISHKKRKGTVKNEPALHKRLHEKAQNGFVLNGKLMYGTEVDAFIFDSRHRGQ